MLVSFGQDLGIVTHGTTGRVTEFIMKDGVHVLKMWVLRLTEKSKGRQQAVSSKVHARTLQVEEGRGEAQEAPQGCGEAIGSIEAQADEGRLPENIPDKAMLPKMSCTISVKIITDLTWCRFNFFRINIKL